ncbi:MAG TPA: type II secretion system minor pseudopilin GspJ [Burkholderiales bacterium]|nr:type II secretion system minor pseudopilin GspJ [Burkholderiales bacterium]
MRTGRGFTLIELLVALLVFGIFSALAYTGLARLLDGRSRLEREQKTWQQLSQVFLRISDDVAHARPRPVRDEAGVALLPAFVGRPYDSRALAEPSLEFTRGGELKYGVAAESDLRRVAYRLKEGKLYRITWPVLDRAPVTKPLEAPLIGDVETFEVRFADNSGNSVNAWPAGGANPNNPPPAVEVTLAVKGVGSFKRLFLVNR